MSRDLAQGASYGPDAIHWFSRRRGGDMSPSETRAFEVWLAADAKNKADLQRLEENWALLADLEDDPAIMAIDDRVRSRLGARARMRVAGALAAGVALTAAGGWVAMNGALADFSWFSPPKIERYSTLVGQQRTFTLSDGSVVKLDTDTALMAQLSGQQRKITLERGQASFQVAKDKSRPFVVSAAGKTVHAIGTVFDVRVEPGVFEVTLIEGRVRVQEQGASRDDGPMANMRPGWKLAVGEDARWRMEPVDLVRETSWHQGVLNFHEDPLVKAVAEMNRYSNRKIVFRGAPPETFVMGNFMAGDVDNFVRAVRLNKLARVTSETQDEVELTAW